MTKVQRWAGIALLCLWVLASRSAMAREPWVLGFASQGMSPAQVISAVALSDGSVVSLLSPPAPASAADPLRLLLCTFDAHGNLRWIKGVPVRTSDRPETVSLLALQDGTFLLFLHAEGSFPPDCGLNVWGSRWTSQGEVLWQRYFSINDIWFSLSAFQVPSGRVFITSGGGELEELNLATGESVWEKVFWVTPPDGWAQGISIGSLAEHAGGDLVLAGGFWWTHDVRDHRLSFLSLGQDGSLQGHREFMQMTPWDVSAGWLIQAPDGGYWLTGSARYWPEDEPGFLWERPFAMKLGADGQIEWQRIYGDGDWTGLFYGPGLEEGGALLVSGIASQPAALNNTALVAAIGSDGSLSNAQAFAVQARWPNAHSYLLGLEAVPDGGLLSWGGYTSELYGPSYGALFSFGPGGELPVSCTGVLPFTGVYGETSLMEDPVPVYTADSSTFQTCPTSASFDAVDGFGTTTEFCGEPYPGIFSVKKLQNPFRLKVTGWNFQEGSLLFVDGIAIAKTRFKGSDVLGRTRLVASGGGLKALLPKGEAVTLTIVNPDGRESVGFEFRR